MENTEYSQTQSQRRRRRSHGHGHGGLPFIFLLFALFIVLSFPQTSEAYKNYTVGDSLGWYDTLEKPSVDYQKWVAAKTFSLGDFLIFNTDNNHSVIQTYNVTTYNHCDYEDASDNDTVQWSLSNPSASSPQPVSVAVPLLKVGMTYFFSSDYDGEQCNNGQRLKINVTYGQGLPKSLRPNDGAPAPVNPDSGDDEAAPDTLVPSNFNHPREVSDDDDGDSSGSVSLPTFSNLFGVQLSRILLFLGFVLIF